jgi:aminopeptidase N
LYDKGYPSSHPIFKNVSSPYEIEEYFDSIESSKAASIFRMLENEVNEAQMFDAITQYLNAHPWSFADINVFYEKIGVIAKKWPAKEFFDRWTKQANYPFVKIEIIDQTNGQQSIQVKQSRNLNSAYSIFSGDLMYPSEYGYLSFSI